MTVNEDIFDASVRHQVLLQRYNAKMVRQMLAGIERMQVRISERLLRTDITEFSKRRLEAQLTAVTKIIKDSYATGATEFVEASKEFAIFERDWQVDMLDRVVPLDVDFATPSKAQVYAAVRAQPFRGKIMRTWLTGLSVDTVASVKAAITNGYQEGQTTAEIVRAIRGTSRLNFKDGLIRRSKNNATTIVRTSLAHTANVAREAVYSENSEVIKGVQWISTLDSKTSAVCRSRDKKVYGVNSGPRPPAHPNCRSATIPVLKSWKELGIDLKEAPEGTRASFNGQIAAGKDYGEWFEGQSASFQDEVLGKAGGQLHRQGGVPLKNFSDSLGREYTLRELRLREKEAWAKAF